MQKLLQSKILLILLIFLHTAFVVVCYMISTRHPFIQKVEKYLNYSYEYNLFYDIKDIKDQYEEDEDECRKELTDLLNANWVREIKPGRKSYPFKRNLLYELCRQYAKDGEVEKARKLLKKHRYEEVDDLNVFLLEAFIKEQSSKEDARRIYDSLFNLMPNVEEVYLEYKRFLTENKLDTSKIRSDFRSTIKKETYPDEFCYLCGITDTVYPDYFVRNDMKLQLFFESVELPENLEIRFRNEWNKYYQVRNMKLTVDSIAVPFKSYRGVKKVSESTFNFIQYKVDLLFENNGVKTPKEGIMLEFELKNGPF